MKFLSFAFAIAPLFWISVDATFASVCSGNSNKCGNTAGCYYTSSCIMCPADTYRVSGGGSTCSACSTVSTGSGTNGVSGAGATSDCKCGAGYYGTASSGGCTQCPLGSYSSNAYADTASCTSCSTGSTTLALGASSSSQCICSAGYGYSSGSCTACSGGMWKSDAANYGCLSSPANAASSDGVQWQCNAGYYLASSTCTACPVSQYKSAVSNSSSCTACSTDKPNSDTLTLASTSCLCNPGYGLSNGACVACGPGFWKSDLSDGTCLPVPANGVAVNGGVSWQCQAGYFLDGNSCTACPIGQYSSSTSNSTSCSNCQTFRSLTTTLSIASTSTSQCACPAGYTLSGGSCVACAGNTWKSFIGDSACLPAVANSIADGFNWLCSPGYLLNGTSCSRCPLSQYKTAVSNSTTCTNCPTNSLTVVTGANSSSYCLCASGTENINGLSCTNCLSGFYKPNPGGALCQACPSGANCTTTGFSCLAGFALNGTSCVQCQSGTYNPTSGSNTCLSCPANAVCSTSSFSCNRGYGFTGGATPCTICPAGTFKSVSANTPCSNCTGGLIAPNPGTLYCKCDPQALSCSFTCPTGLYAPAYDTNCVSCPDNAVCATNTFQCIAGAYSTSNVTCSLCPFGSYYPTNSLTTSCTNCPANSACNSLPSTSFACNRGYTLSDDSLGCRACDAFSYKDTVGSGSCQACPATTGTGLLGALSADYCLCGPGYSFDGYSCVPCGSGTFKTTFSNTDSCIAPPTANAVINTDSTGWYCAAGFTLDQTGAHCVACLPGFVKLQAGNGACSCGSNSVPLSNTTCGCNAGYEYTSSQCSQCKSGFYKSAAGNTACLACPSNTVSCTSDKFTCASSYQTSNDGLSCVVKSGSPSSSSSSSLAIRLKTTTVAAGTGQNSNLIGSSDTVIIGAGSALVVIILLVIVFVCFCLLRNRGSKDDSYASSVEIKSSNQLVGGAPATQSKFREYGSPPASFKRYSDAPSDVVVPTQASNRVSGVVSAPSSKFATAQAPPTVASDDSARVEYLELVTDGLVESGEGLTVGVLCAIYKAKFNTLNLPFQVSRRLLGKEDFAMKLVYDDESSPSPDNGAAATKLLKKEADILCNVEHENIVKIVAIIQDPFAIIMHLCSSCLFDELHDPAAALQGKFANPRIQYQIMSDIVRGMSALHEAMVCHCDLNPKNVLLEYAESDTNHMDPKAVICGFSACYNMANSRFGQAFDGAYAFTPNYCAPEALNASGFEYLALDLMACDVFAVGMTFIEILEQRTPHEGMDKTQILELINSYPDAGWWNSDNPKILAFVRETCANVSYSRPSISSLKEKLQIAMQ